jgi:hypothetical protein
MDRDAVTTATDNDYLLQRVSVTYADLKCFTQDLARQDSPVVGFHIYGAGCPHCHHETSDVFPVKVVVFANGAPKGRIRLLSLLTRTWQKLRKKAGPTDDSPTEIRRIGSQHCQCTWNHTNSDGKFGCGASWLVKATFDLTQQKVDSKKLKEQKGNSEDNEIVSTVHITSVPKEQEARYWPSADAFASTVPNALTSVQASAGKWQTGLTAILGIVGAVALIGGRDTLQQLGPDSKVLLISLATLALLANLAAISLATLANVGVPRMTRIKGPEDLMDADLRPLRQTRRAIDRLRWAIVSALLAFLASIAAVGVLWLAPGKTAAQPLVTLRLTVGARTVTTCGSFGAGQIKDGYFTFMASGSDSAVTYRTRSVISISPAVSC